LSNHHGHHHHVNRLHPSDASQQLMSTSLNSQSSENFANGKLTKRYQIDSSREAMQSSNYSLSSTASHDTRSSHAVDGNGKPRPPKPPRKTIGDRSKAKSLDADRALKANTLAKSDFNVDYTAADSDVDQSGPSQKKTTYSNE